MDSRIFLTSCHITYNITRFLSSVCPRHHQELETCNFEDFSLDCLFLISVHSNSGRLPTLDNHIWQTSRVHKFAKNINLEHNNKCFFLCVCAILCLFTTIIFVFFWMAPSIHTFSFYFLYFFSRNNSLDGKLLGCKDGDGIFPLFCHRQAYAVGQQKKLMLQISLFSFVIWHNGRLTVLPKKKKRMLFFEGLYGL